MEVFLNQTSPVNGRVIPDQHDRSRYLPEQRFDKGQDVSPRDGTAVRSSGQSDPSSSGRENQGAQHIDPLMVIDLGQQVRRLSFRCLGALERAD